ncbi:hypothetical protein P7C70_g7310, partial [Phenoliferia sp. Uapishka_3]
MGFTANSQNMDPLRHSREVSSVFVGDQQTYIAPGTPGGELWNRVVRMMLLESLLDATQLRHILKPHRLIGASSPHHERDARTACYALYSLLHYKILSKSHPTPLHQLPLPPHSPQLRPSKRTHKSRTKRLSTGGDVIGTGLENVVFILWSLAESNTKLLASLNVIGEDLVVFLRRLVASEGGEGGEMDVEAKKRTGKKAAANKSVPIGVTLAAAQTLHALISSNPPAQAHLLSPASSATLISLTTLLSSPSPALSPSDASDHLTLRVVAFGILLELSKSSAAKKSHHRDSLEAIKSVLKDHSYVLVGLVRTDLNEIVKEGVQAASEMDPKLTAGAPPTGPGNKLLALEKKLSTLQLSLEILGEWCASLDAEGLGAIAEGSDEDEEWGGIDAGGDVEMGDDEEEGDERGAQDEAEGIVSRKMEEDDEEAPEEDSPVELNESALSLFSNLPLLLLTLAQPTSLSFAPTTSSITLAATAPSTLLPTSTSPLPSAIPEALTPLSDLLTTVHVRSLECLNNLYITLARSKNAADCSKDLQKVWEGTLELVLGAVQGEVVTERVEGSAEEGEERKMEVVMAGVGAAWGMARVGLGEDGELIVGEQATPFLISVFSHPFATAATPAGEAIRVRVAGALGWIGRRSNIAPAENETIGLFLLSLLPHGKTASPLSPTPEVLLQAIDSIIDLYSDEDAPCDVPVFRQKGFLGRLEDAVAGVRAATKRIDKKKFPELRSRADGALENLVAFVQYRKEISG